MLSGIRRAFGVIKVEENDREIIISGLSSSSFVSDIMKLWNTQRIADYMFSRISSSELRFSNSPLLRQNEFRGKLG